MKNATDLQSPLPVPVRRYLDLALPERASTRAPSTIVLTQRGTLRISTSATRWLPFSAIQTVKPLASEFSWNARVRLAPLLHLSVQDSFQMGHGAGEIRLGWFRVDHDAGSVEIDSGALHRFLAEAPFYPWALLPSPALKWTHVDESRALATMKVGTTEVALEFRFMSGGEIESVYTPGRWGRFGRTYRQTPWEGCFAEYSRHSGVLMPGYAEVGWHENERLELVWRGRISSASFEGPSLPR